MVVAEAQLAGRADHAVGDVAVGLAGRDRERPGQHGAGQRDGDQVADGEVGGAADDAARLPARRRRPGTSGSVLPFFCGSSSKSSTSPTTTPVTSAPSTSTRSTSSPARISAAADVGTADVRRAGRRSRAARTAGRASGLHAERAEGEGEPHVALDQVADVLDAVPEHQGALEPMPNANPV